MGKVLSFLIFGSFVWIAGLGSASARLVSDNAFREDRPAYFFRIWSLFPRTQYSSVSNVTFGTGSFDEWSAGVRMEALEIPADQMRRLPFSAKFTSFYDLEFIKNGIISGKFVSYFSAGVYQAFWPLGAPARTVVVSSTHQYVRKSEFLVYTGPAFQRLTELRTSVLSTDLSELEFPMALGLRLGLRSCIPFSDSGCLEIAGSATLPMVLLKPWAGSLNRSDAVSYDVSLMLDYAVSSNVSLGIGAVRSVYQLDYTLDGDRVQHIKYSNITPTCSFQLRY